MQELKIVRIGALLGIAPPSEMIERFGVKEGDLIYGEEIGDRYFLTNARLQVEYVTKIGQEIHEAIQ